MYLLLLDVNSIQNYIFETNTLKEIIGASSLISAIQKEYVFNCLRNLDGNIEKYDNSHNILHFNSKQIGKEAKNYEVIVSDGGNTIILFSDKTESEKFEKNIKQYYSKYDIQVTSNIFSINPDEQGTKYFHLIKELKKIKNQGITSGCSISSYPMKYCISCAKRYVEFKDKKREEDNDIDLLCRVCHSKRHYGDKGLGNLEEQIIAKYKSEEGEVFDFEFPRDMNEIRNYKTKDIALISFDGNKVGNYIKNCIFKDSDTILQCLRRYRQFSENLHNSIENAVVNAVYEIFPNPDKYIRFRPLILAGDDITIVIDSAYAIDFINNFNNNCSKDKFFQDTNIKFSIGLVISKANFPLHQLFDLSHELLSSAKKKPANNNIKEPAIDYHFISSSLFGNLSYMRNKEYKVSISGDNYNCTNRPFFWGAFQDILKKAEKIKRFPNSKVKSLREILRLGNAESLKELKRFKIHLKEAQERTFGNIISDLWMFDTESNEYKTELLDIIELSELV